MAAQDMFEPAFLLIIFLGIVSSFLTDSLFLQGLTIFTFGILSAIIKELRKFETNFPHIMLIVGFLFGYLLFIKNGFRLVMIFVFVLGLLFGTIGKKFMKDKYHSKI